MPTEQEIQSVTRKIKALLAKTIEAGATEAEAMSAFTKAHELLEAYQIGLSDLDIREEGTSHIKQSMDDIARRMSKKVGQYCECKVWFSDLQHTVIYKRVGKKEKKFQGPKEYTKINFVGIKTDADFAEWLMAALASYVQGKEIGFLFAEENNSVYATTDFVTGCIDRINERLQFEIDKRNANKAKSTGRDLIPLKNAMITEAFAKLGIQLVKTNFTNHRPVDMNAYGRGQSAGDGVGFHRPMHDDRDEQRLLR